MHVCDNVGDHLIGNVYARYEWDEDAQRAVDTLNARWYNSRPLFAELSPVADFRDARCRQNERLRPCPLHEQRPSPRRGTCCHKH